MGREVDNGSERPVGRIVNTDHFQFGVHRTFAGLAVAVQPCDRYGSLPHLCRTLLRVRLQHCLDEAFDYEDKYAFVIATHGDLFGQKIIPVASHP